MADNVTVDNGTGTDYTVASDDDGTAQHQYVKLEYGADGTFTKVSSSNPLPISDAAGSLTVDGTVAVSGLSGTVAVTQSGTWDEVGINDSGNSITVDDGSGSLTVDGTVAATQSGTWTVQPGNTANTTAWKVDGSAVTQPISVAGTVAVTQSGTWDEIGINDSGNSITVDGTVTANAGSGTFAAKETRAATSALTSVSDTSSSTSILAANANRLKAVVTNDSSARLYLRFEAAAASTSNYMVSLAQNETWEELSYTGEIRGIWATDPNDGAARVTEFTA